MGKALRESFIPILGVLGLLFAVLLYVRYEVALDADAVTVITIQAQSSESPDSEMAGQERLVFGAADKQLDAVDELIAEHKWQQAEKQLQELTQQRNDSRSWVTYGVLRYKQERYTDALNYLGKGAERSPVWPGLYFYRALVNSHLDAIDEALADYQKLIALNPNHFEARYNMGLLKMRQQKFTEAAQLFSEATTLGGGARRARAHYQWGQALLEQGKEHYPQALKQFELAIRYLPAFIEPRLAIARMEPDTEEGRKSAEEQYFKALELAPGNPSALFALAQHYSGIGDNAKAVVRYRELLQFEPEHEAAHYNLGLLLLDDKKWREAQEQFNWVIQRDPKNTKALFNRGRARYRLQEYKEAIADYKEAIALQNGNYPEALLNTGLVQTALKDYAAAEQSYRKAIAQREDYAAAWYNLGLLHMRQKQTAEAVAAFNHAVSLRKGYARAWYNLGVLYGREEQNELAIGAYEEALRLRPNYTNARLNLAVRLLRVDKPKKAIEQYQAALSYDDTYSTAWYNLALVYQQIKQYAEARDALHKMLALEPENVAALKLLAESEAALGNAREAVHVLERALDIEPNNPELRLALAHNLRTEGDIKRARSEVYKGLSLDPEHPQLRAELALLGKD